MVVCSKLHLQADWCAHAVCNQPVEVCKSVLLCHYRFWVQCDDFRLEVLVVICRLGLGLKALAWAWLERAQAS